ncbi:melanocyte-stimulating hormone receptor-like [Montipora foliosa]|uniref:melanocyte-stimulating hormone receptor-like n=1 Tax=Montipora foliosa TaxID=591990 RepID=UPI0035F1887D
MTNSTIARHENQDEVSLSACSEALNSRKPVTGVEYTPELFIPLSLSLSLVTFSGNLLIFLVLHKVSSIHPPSRVFFRCLLITDLCVGLFSQPLFVGYLMAVKEKNRSLCSRTESLAFAVSTVLCGQSITTLTAISVDRLLALWLGIRYRQVVTLPRVRLSVTILWVANFAFTFTYYWNKRVFFLWGCGYIFTCLIISTCCYFKIYLVLGYRHVKIQPLSQGISASRRREVLRTSPAQIQGKNPRVLAVLNIKRYKKTVSNAIWVHSLLVICYLPYTVATAVTASRGEPLYGTRYKLLGNITGTLLFFNSLLNPFLYCWRMKGIRQAVKQLLRSIFSWS